MLTFPSFYFLLFQAAIQLSGIEAVPQSPVRGRSIHKVFESHSAPSTFTKFDIPSDKQHFLNLKIALKQKNSAGLEEKLLSISDPESPDYGRHLSSSEIRQFSSPKDEALEMVSQWLLEHGFEKPRMKWSHSRDWVTLEGVPLRKVEEMLNTKYSYFKHSDGDHLIRAETYSLPHHLHEHIEMVQPTTMFGRLNVQGSSVSVIDELNIKLLKPVPGRSDRADTYCVNASAVTNKCLRELYKTLDYTPVSALAGNMIGVTAFIGERAYQSDLQDFLARERPESRNAMFNFVSVNGGGNPQNDTDQSHLGVEGNLDIQTTMGFTAPTPNIFYTTAGSPPFTPDEFTQDNSNEPYLEWLDYMSGLYDHLIPKVITTSYGDNEQTVPISYANRVCMELAALGARGVSLIFPSGDNGVGESGTCFSNDGQKTPKFTPSFPASCPYVTTVGATQEFHPEVAVEPKIGGFYSGGGFSEYFPKPNYQAQAVANYLYGLGGAYNGVFNSRGRAYPDVAAQGARYVVSWRGRTISVSGTSASAPTFASVIALLNDHRISQGQSSLGFLNPWLYSAGKAGLKDIRSGSSAGCDTPGFPAARGWDPVTGLGTPDFKKLLQISDQSFPVNQYNPYPFNPYGQPAPFWKRFLPSK